MNKNEPQNTTPTTDTATVQISKADFDKMQSMLESMGGMKTLIEQQGEALKAFQAKAEEQANQIKNLTAAVAEANSRAENAVSASKSYVRPATIASGECEYLSFEASVLYKQGNASGVITEKEIKIDVEMPKPCGHLNSVSSELRGRIVPKKMAEKGITNYLITGVVFDSEKVKTESKKVSFAGKKPLEFSAEECQEFAIIYEGLRIPVNADLMTLRNAVAAEWGYIAADVAPNDPWIINGRPVNKLEQPVDLVAYHGVRQHMPRLDAVSPSKFREIADDAADTSESTPK